MHRFWTAAAATLVVLAAAAPATSVVAAAPPTSTALVLSTTTSSYGQTVTATATVTARPGPAQGDVVFSVDGTKIPANLGANGAASVVLPRATVGTYDVTATFVPQFSDSQGPSSTVETWVVSQVRTRLQVRVIGRGARIPTSVQVKAAGDWGTRPTGRVSMVIRRIASGTVSRKARTFSSDAVALAGFGRLRKGTYRLVVSYTGDTEHLAVRHFERFAVRQR